MADATFTFFNADEALQNIKKVSYYFRLQYKRFFEVFFEIPKKIHLKIPLTTSFYRIYVVFA